MRNNIRNGHVTTQCAALYCSSPFFISAEKFALYLYLYKETWNKHNTYINNPQWNNALYLNKLCNKSYCHAWDILIHRRQRVNICCIAMVDCIRLLYCEVFIALYPSLCKYHKVP